MSNSRASVFDFTRYKDFLLHWIANQPNKGRGERSRIAEALHCQLAYVSQVLSGDAHFSLEQAEALNTLLGHTDDEADFFSLLVQLDRAGSEALRNRIKKKIRKITEQRLILKNRLSFEKTLSREDQITYYSQWYYTAIHVALAIPHLHTKEALARSFGLPLSKVSQILEFLISRGLAREEKGRYSVGSVRFHLENDSPMISKHHSNWRMKAIQSLEREDRSELHYSSTITIAEADVPKVREVLIKAIESVREIVRPSKDEAVYCYTLDLFRLTGE